MEVDVQISKIIKDGGNSTDWLALIEQYKQGRCDRDLLANVYTVALNNLKDRFTKGHKKLLVGLANLQSETSLEKARRTILQAITLDSKCAIVCVYWAQLERRSNVDEAYKILRNGRNEGKKPKQLIMNAYKNIRDGKSSLFDGIPDPWDDALLEDDTATATQNQKFSSPTPSGSSGSVRILQRSSSKSKNWNIGKPVRASNRSSNSGLKSMPNKSPVESLREQLGNIVGGEFHVRQDIDCNGGDSGVFTIPQLPKGSEDKENEGIKYSAKPAGPSLDFLQEYSPFKVDNNPLSYLENVTRFTPFGQAVWNSVNAEQKNSDISRVFKTPSKTAPVSRSCFLLSPPNEQQINRKVCTGSSNTVNGLQENLGRNYSVDSGVSVGSLSSVSEDSEHLTGPLTTQPNQVAKRVELDEECVVAKRLIGESKPDCISSNEGSGSGHDKLFPKLISNNAISDISTRSLVDSVAVDEILSTELSQNKTNTKADLKRIPFKHCNSSSCIGASNNKSLMLQPSKFKSDSVLLNTKSEEEHTSKSIKLGHSENLSNDNCFRENLTGTSSPSNVSTSSDACSSENASGMRTDSFGNSSNRFLTVIQNDAQKDHVSTLDNNVKPVAIKSHQETETGLTNYVWSLGIKDTFSEQKLKQCPEQIAANDKSMEGLNGKKNEINALLSNGLKLLGQSGFNMNSTLQEIKPSEKPPSRPIKKKDIFMHACRYTSYGVIGSGGSCKVYKVADSSGRIFAIKRVKLLDLDQFLLDAYRKEIMLLEKMKGNPYIIKIFDWEITEDYLLILLEKGEGDLAAKLRQHPIEKSLLKRYWKQMLVAVSAIHDVGIVHTDLKPANFLFVGDDHDLKLIDFGIADAIQDNKTSVTREVKMGTMNYMAPETLLEDVSSDSDATRVSFASDVWSLGCILYLMVYKKTPYGHIRNNRDKERAIKNNTPIEFKHLDDDALLDCMKGCLRYNKRERYKIEELLHHPFLTPRE